MKIQNPRQSFFECLLNPRGQIAIFVALIFQVLFVFFAMIINVGLLVHHKINLQNSVDLAAYYAAAKQAENLNAIAHINYQIRQAWKLLSWRYLILGGIGQIDHPMGPLKDNGGGLLRTWSAGTEQDVPVFPTSGESGLGLSPVFCISHRPSFEQAETGESKCKKASNENISRIIIPQNLATHAAFNAALVTHSMNLRTSADRNVEMFGPTNYAVLGLMIKAYRTDNRNRRNLINAIAGNMSINPNDFYDVEGESVFEGAKKTLSNNLNSESRSAIVYQNLYNSLADSNCKQAAVADVGNNAPPGWLADVLVSPAYAFRDSGAPTTANYGIEVKYFPNAPNDPAGQPYPSAFDNLWKNLLQYMHQPIPTVNLFDSLGVEKNPWCMAYVGFEAVTAPKLPFLPGNPIKLRARAFAKPFGGRIGPWYYKNWQRGAPFSQGAQNQKTDPVVAPRLGPGLQVSAADAQNLERMPNYSRYPGDKLGLNSAKMFRHYGLAIMGQAPIYYTYDLSFWLDSGYEIDSYQNIGGDPLAYNQTGQQAPQINANWERMRKLELGAIAPDIFDISYYSIEPDFASLYLPKLKKLVAKQNVTQAAGGALRVRGDLGWRDSADSSINSNSWSGYPAFDKFSVKHQIAAFNEALYATDKIYQTVMKPDHLLTSWAESSLTNFELSQVVSSGFFAKCHIRPDEPNMPPTSGDCIGGGRSGYSVKLVNENYLNGSHEGLGGEGTSGAILNPPPGFGEF